MKTFKIYKHDEYGYEAVKVGFSWPGFVFNSVWFLYKQLWFYAVLFFITSILLSVAVADYNPVIQYVLLIFLAILAGVKGNKWREKKLERNNYQLVKAIPSESAEEAIERIENEKNSSSVEYNQNNALKENIKGITLGKVAIFFISAFFVIILECLLFGFLYYVLEFKAVPKGLFWLAAPIFIGLACTRYDVLVSEFIAKTSDKGKQIFWRGNSFSRFIILSPLIWMIFVGAYILVFDPYEGWFSSEDKKNLIKFIVTPPLLLVVCYLLYIKLINPPKKKERS
ncbi:DUF2628 domain-containing protein [Endozoicomonas euniceicola]|uniref:DUF2628 domain-containing protein n=1 Tax=Endozoicomonas euniceicola TaxID=1234143 RepID=A0ABY6GPA9_9GAMM|nr:DUF2628 domain-containing protein [Endozoicomonas euniceicola]UYM14588.1 DUF2628 domain-containing protein [Endozoicomonas euniceicola]